MRKEHVTDISFINKSSYGYCTWERTIRTKLSGMFIPGSSQEKGTMDVWSSKSLLCTRVGFLSEQIMEVSFRPLAGYLLETWALLSHRAFSGSHWISCPFSSGPMWQRHYLHRECINSCRTAHPLKVYSVSANDLHFLALSII